MIKLFFPLLLHFHSRHYFTLHSITETHETPKTIRSRSNIAKLGACKKATCTHHYDHKYKIHNSKTTNYDVPYASYILTLSTEI